MLSLTTAAAALATRMDQRGLALPLKVGRRDHSSNELKGYTYPKIPAVPRTSFPLLEQALGLPARSLVRGEPLDLNRIQIYDLLATKDESELEKELFEYADSVTEKFFGKKVWLRGIVEFSNVCEKNCNYCGIRREMPQPVDGKPLFRYTMPKEEIVDCALWTQKQRLGTIMLQSGEITSPARVQWLCDLVKEIRDKTRAADTRRGEGLAVALSTGELTLSDYQRLAESGARRYLLRIESSNPMLYSKLHPQDGKHSWEARLQCLRDLKTAGLQLGTGVMIGLPEQSLWDMASDIVFFKDIGADMIGMGPYILQKDTPTGRKWLELNPDKGPAVAEERNRKLFSLSSRMIALTRIALGDVNIAATTALQALNPIGREITLRRGANMMMPIVTPTKYREDYQLYEGKPCIHEAAEDCHGCMIGRVLMAKKEVAHDLWGDPPHYNRSNFKKTL